MTNSTRCALLAKQACTTLSHVVQKITPPSANNFLKLFFALFAMLALGVGNAWGETTISFGFANWDGVTANFSGTAKDEVTQTVDGVKVTYTRNGSNLYANTTAIRFYKSNTLKFDAPTGYSIQSIAFTCSSYQTDITSNVGTCTATSSNLSWSGDATSVTFTRPSGASSYATITGATVTLAATSGGSTPDPGTGEGGEDPETPGTGGSGTIVIKYNSTFAPALPTTKDGANATSTEHTVENLTIKEQGLYNNGSGYIMFVQGKGFLYNTQSLGTITSVSVTYTGGTSTAGEAGVYFGSTEQSTYTTTSNQTIKGQSQTDTWTNTIEGNGFFQLSTSYKNVQITQIEITYTSGGSTEPAPSVTLTPDVKDFGTVNVGETLSQEFTITTENTTASLTASIDNTTDYAVSAIDGDKVTVTYQPQSAGTHPAVLTVKAGEEATATVNLKGKAVQALEGTWVLVTDASSLTVGSEIIIAASESNVALSTTQNDNNRGQVEVTKTDNTITATTEAQVLTLQTGNVENTLALYTGVGYLCAASSSSNYLRTETELSGNSSWSIAVAADGTATLIAQGANTRNTLFYNSSSKIFSCYASSTTTQKAIALYKKTNGQQLAGLTYATTKYLTKLGETFATPVLANPNSVDVTYESSDNNVATVAADGAITIKAAGVVKITASFAGNSSFLEGSASYTIGVTEHAGTQADPYTVADARRVIDVMETAEGVYANGIVSEIVTAYNEQYGNISYNISADGLTTSDQLQAYRGKSYDGANFTSPDNVKVGDEVVIKGTLKKFSTTYEFDENNQLVSLNRTKEQAGLAYAETEHDANVGEDFAEPELTNPNGLSVEYSTSDATLATVNASTGDVTIGSKAGTVTITASFAGNENYVAGEASYTITITDPALAIATLPFEFNGGLNDIVSTAGITQEGLGSDYTNDNAQNSKLKFDHTGDYIIIHFDTKPDKLMYNIKSNSFSGGTFLVQESTDGETYSTICTYQDEFDDKPDALHTLQATSRYVKFIYTEKSSGNVGLGNIKITKLDTRKEAGLAWSTTSYNTYDGDETLAPTLTNPYSLNITYSSSNEDVATIDGAGKLTLKNTGITTITATFAGNENYKEAEVSYTLSYASKWATTYTSNIEVGSDEYSVIIGGITYENQSQRYGNSSTAGYATLYLPAETETLHFHAAGWNSEDVTITAKIGEEILGTFELEKDAGISGNSKTYTLQGNTSTEQYFYIDLTSYTIAANTAITFEATEGKRFVLYGVNQEGGIAPELNRIEITGEATTLTYEIGDVFDPAGLGVNAIYTLAGVDHETVAIDAEDVEWSFNPATIAAETSQVEVTATYEGKTATKTVTGLTVIIPEPEILVTPQTISFNASQNQSIDTKTINITLKNVTSATVSLTGDGASAFNIDKTQFTESGSLTITPNTSNVGTFKAAITIADDAGVAESKKVTLTLNVTTTDNLNGTWSLITDASNLKANIKVIIASAADGETIYTMGAQNTNNRAAIHSSVVGNTLKPELGTKVFTLVNAGDGKFALKAINGKYLYAASSGSNHLKEKDEIDVDGQWTITIADNVATIKAEGSSNRNWIRFNPNNGTPLFSCYASGQEDICLYTTHVTVNGTTDNTSIPDQSDVTVDNAELTVTKEAEYDNMYIGGNGSVDVEETVTVNNLYISTTMGATTSGQLRTASENLNVTGDVFIDITLGDNANPQKWHAFTVPFPVDAMNGVYDLNDNKLTNEVNYAIMDYHGDLRANGQYGWKKYRGILVPGTFYLMTVDGERDTYRFKKVKDAELIAPATKELKAYTGSGDATKDKGWNGVGNPTLMHGKVEYKALILNPTSYTYEAYDPKEVAFTVGTPFFIQAAADATVTIAAEVSGSLALARRAAAVENIKVMLGNSDYTDRLYVSASEDATNEYEIGKDLAKMIMTKTPSVPQIFAEAYNTSLCMIDAPMANNEAVVALNLYAPANGEYTLSIEAQDNEKVYLLHEGTFVWDLSMSEYPITLNKGDNTGYSILVHRADAPTSVETIDGTNNQTEKLIHNGNLYILHNGKVFDAVGTMLK